MERELQRVRLCLCVSKCMWMVLCCSLVQGLQRALCIVPATVTAVQSVALMVVELYVLQVFELLDTGGYGSLDFRQFLTGLSVLNGHGKVGTA